MTNKMLLNKLKFLEEQKQSIQEALDRLNTGPEPDYDIGALIVLNDQYPGIIVGLNVSGDFTYQLFYLTTEDDHLHYLPAVEPDQLRPLTDEDQFTGYNQNTRSFLDMYQEVTISGFDHE